MTNFPNRHKVKTEENQTNILLNRYEFSAFDFNFSA